MRNGLVREHDVVVTRPAVINAKDTETTAAAAAAAPMPIDLERWAADDTTPTSSSAIGKSIPDRGRVAGAVPARLQSGSAWLSHGEQEYVSFDLLVMGHVSNLVFDGLRQQGHRPIRNVYQHIIPAAGGIRRQDHQLFV